MRLGQAEIRELTRKGVTRGGWNYSFGFAKFYLNKLLLPGRRASLMDHRSREFVEKLTREGWVILGSPLVTKPRLVPEHELSPNAYSAKGGLWMPRQLWLDGIIPDTHPWVHPGEDLFFIRVPVKRQVKPVEIEIDDDVLKHWQDTRDPILDKLVVAT